MNDIDLRRHLNAQRNGKRINIFLELRHRRRANKFNNLRTTIKTKAEVESFTKMPQTPLLARRLGYPIVS